MQNTVIGIVDRRDQAEAIVTSLRTAGFDNSVISALLPDQEGTHDFAHEHHTKAPEGAVAGAGAGGIIGGTIGLLAGVGAMAIPGLGPFIAAGPLMAALSGAAGGAALGSVFGSLVGLGIPEIEARRYEGKVRGGNILLAVHAANREAQKAAARILRDGGAHDVDTMNEEPVPRRTPLDEAHARRL
jgi:hypothetical protein